MGKAILNQIPKLRFFLDNIRRNGDDYILIIGHKVFFLNETTFDIIKAIDGKKNIASIINSLEENYYIPDKESNQFREEVISLILDLKNKEIITIS